MTMATETKPTWRDTSFGKLYRRFLNAHANAWARDAEAGFVDSWGADKRSDKAWAAFRETEKEFEAALEKLLEHQPRDDADTPPVGEEA